MTKNKDEAEVTLLGQTIEDKKGGCGRDTNVSGGIFFIFLGIIFLLNTLEILPWMVWGEAYRFWPLILVSIGFRIMLGSNLISKLLLTIVNLYIFGSLLLFLLFKYAPTTVYWIPGEISKYVLFWGGVK